MVKDKAGATLFTGSVPSLSDLPPAIRIRLGIMEHSLRSLTGATTHPAK